MDRHRNAENAIVDLAIVGSEAIANNPTVRDDANLPRLLSRLHLIDLIAGQIDRHSGNYFVQMDKSGNVVGLTGIDLDMSFFTGKGGKGDNAAALNVEKGSHYADGRRSNWLPGLGMYADAELAGRIIALNPEHLRAVLTDLLPAASIEAAVERLVQLQAALKVLQSKGQLLEPGQWDAAVRQKLAVESEDNRLTGGGDSYYGREMTEFQHR